MSAILAAAESVRALQSVRVAGQAGSMHAGAIRYDLTDEQNAADIARVM